MNLDEESGMACDVVLVDPDRLFREAFAELLGRSGFEVVRTAALSRELEDGGLWHSGAGQRLFVIDMAEEVQELRERLTRLVPAAEVKLVAISHAATAAKLHLALDLGFHACLTKDMSFESFRQCIRVVLSGGSVFPTKLAHMLLSEPGGRPKRPVAAESLTSREQAVLGHLTQGASNKVIARHLGVSDATIKVRLKSVFRKLDVSNRTKAAAWAVRASMPAEGGNSGEAPAFSLAVAGQPR